MILRFFDLDVNNTLEFAPSRSVCLTIENQDCYINIVKYFKGIDGEEKSFCILSGDKELVYSKDYTTVIDCYDFETVSRTVAGKTIKVVSDAIDKNDAAAFAIRRKLADLYSSVADALNDYDVEFDSTPDRSPEDILKFFSVSPASSRESVFDKFLNLIELTAVLKLYKLIVFVNLKSFLNERDITELQKAGAYKGVDLLFLENYSHGYSTEYEDNYLLDRDLFLTKVV